jgi:hypothetical protein
VIFDHLGALSKASATSQKSSVRVVALTNLPLSSNLRSYYARSVQLSGCLALRESTCAVQRHTRPTFAVNHESEKGQFQDSQILLMMMT